MNAKLAPNETELIGKWNRISGRMVADNVCSRIDWLISGVLKRVAIDESGWSTLYLDESDGRYWELSYPQSEMHGGGPPTMRMISREKAHETFTIGDRNGRPRA